MPTNPLPEVDRDEDTIRDEIVNISRKAYAAAVPKEVGWRAWLALVVLLVVVATSAANIPLAIAGGLAVMYLAVDLTKRGSR